MLRNLTPVRVRKVLELIQRQGVVGKKFIREKQ